jgi:hypothetical protein
LIETLADQVDPLKEQTLRTTRTSLKQKESMSPLSSSQGSKEGKELRTKSRAGSESFESSSQQSTASHKRKISQTLDACSTPRSNKTEKSQPTTDSEVNNQEAGTSSDDVNTGRVTRVTRSKSKLKQNPNSHSVHSPASSTSSNR